MNLSFHLSQTYFHDVRLYLYICTVDFIYFSKYGAGN